MATILYYSIILTVNLRIEDRGKIGRSTSKLNQTSNFVISKDNISNSISQSSRTNNINNKVKNLRRKRGITNSDSIYYLLAY